MKAKPGSKDLLSGHEWYEAQAYRAINQALGRCIRHKNDWGAIILLEERFNNRNVVNGLSKWVKSQFKQLSHFGSSMEGLEHFIKRQLEEDRKKAEEKREKMRLQEESVIKFESHSFETDTITIHSSQSFEIKENIISPDKSNGMINQEEQSSASTTSKYFNQCRQTSDQLQSIENTIMTHENQEPSPVAIFDIDNTELPLLENSPKEQELDRHTHKDSYFVSVVEKEPHNAIDDNLHNLIPPKLSYVKLEPHQLSATTATNTTTPTSPESDIIHFSCPNCSKSLLHGPRNDIELVNVVDLECIKIATDNRCVVQELQNPGLWETSLQLLGDPLKIQSLASRTSVIYDRIDNLCFRPLACACNASIELGMVVCLATDPIKMHHVGKVYLWGFGDDRSANIGVSFKPEQLHKNEDLNMEFPNSQYSSANDIFYNL
ncbi:helicase C-terminal domain-containing protein [Parasitella parasitica]|nr:helicase C-terminal domain-containing protein [Parasitella parasitica]